MPSRHWQCSAAVEPRLAARHLEKNPLPTSSPQGIASVAHSLAANFQPLAAPQTATAYSLPLGCATAEAWPGVCPIPRTDDLCACKSAVAPAPSLGTTQNSILKVSLPFAVPVLCKCAHFRLSHFWGSLHTLVTPDCLERNAVRNLWARKELGHGGFASRQSWRTSILLFRFQTA